MIPIFDLVSQYKAFAYEQKCKRNPITMKEALWTTINHTLDDKGCSFTNISIANIQNMAPNTNIQTSPFVLADSKEGKVSTPKQGILTIDLDWIDEYQRIVPSRLWVVVVVITRSKKFTKWLLFNRPAVQPSSLYKFHGHLHVMGNKQDGSIHDFNSTFWLNDWDILIYWSPDLCPQIQLGNTVSVSV